MPGARSACISRDLGAVTKVGRTQRAALQTQLLQGFDSATAAAGGKFAFFVGSRFPAPPSSPEVSAELPACRLDKEGSVLEAEERRRGTRACSERKQTSVDRMVGLRGSFAGFQRTSLWDFLKSP